MFWVVIVAQFQQCMSDQPAEKTTAPSDAIAIIGMGCRFPGGSDSPAAFWQVLVEGRDAVCALPVSRCRADAPSPIYGGFLEQVDQFDAAFFGIAPREALALDPQQRLVLEVGWEALEHAGIDPHWLFDQPVGVFLGACFHDYALLSQQQPLDSPQRELHRLTGTILGALAGRLAYHLGVVGPALVVDTTSSSSLVAVHQACQSLRTQECDLALAGGVNLILDDAWADVAFAAEDSIHAPDGRCKVFDAAADGFGRGEGCGIVVLKRLRQAEADGDPILGIIRSSLVNQDGRSSGLSAPNGRSQELLIRQALRQAGCSPAEVGYVEAHGTGTKLGDAVELGTLATVFGERDRPLWIGSVKSNIAHLEAAAGIAGFIKVVLALQHGQIPPHLHLHQPNPQFDWARLPLQIPQQLEAWPGPRRIAGVNSFGISGTNAHVVVEGWDGPHPPAPLRLRSVQASPVSGRGGTEHSLGQPRIGDWAAPDGPHPPAPL
ncbi:MAG: polyketide synthase, partial [Candidatus Viridilinea halotolerans]